VRHTIIAAVALILANHVPAAGKLTPKEIADGWIMLFDGETTFGWSVEGKAEVADGMLVLGGGDKPTVLTTKGVFGHADVRCMYRHEGGKGATMSWRGELHKLSADADGFAFEELYGSADDKVSAIVVNVPASTKLKISHFSAKPKGMKPLFNGKDLTGWKQFTANPKQAKSKFSVTPEGWLSLKDGPGDLQTEAQFDDFILQLECISNGKHLNSGIFFRCIPGEYQQGYEAQIQNGYKGDDRTKPTDYGTGAIYRRQPARKVVSNDHEWFTMTVLAHGNHLATWVNGYQVTDFTDERPANNNARNGSKTAKGPISIQGHDPTTDLSFRNIRIASLKKD
jgi:hypothetical protein